MSATAPRWRRCSPSIRCRQFSTPQAYWTTAWSPRSPPTAWTRCSGPRWTGPAGWTN
ncbi:hypothetical protein NKG94_02315 [Micromonospora sp. M12]